MRMEFEVGGQDRELSEQQQSELLEWYFREHYPITDEENWLAHLPDRLTHAAMMQLGSAAGHEMPGTVFTDAVSVVEDELGMMFVPDAADSSVGKLAVASFGRPFGPASENFYFPLVAAAAQLSGVRILATNDIAAARSLTEIGWGFGAGCSMIEDAGFDTVILTRADGNFIATPAEYRREIAAVAKLLRQA